MPKAIDAYKIYDLYHTHIKLRTPLPRGSSLCEGMGEGCCTQPYPCICKEAVSGFEQLHKNKKICS